jgi:hypothetical protein
LLEQSNASDRQRHLARLAVFRSADGNDPSAEIDVAPLEGEQLASAHPGFDREGDQ